MTGQEKAIEDFALTCPECRLNGHEGRMKMGNRRHWCDTCNRFAQAVMRHTRKRLIALHQDEFDRLRPVVEVELYPTYARQFLRKMDEEGL